MDDAAANAEAYPTPESDISWSSSGGGYTLLEDGHPAVTTDPVYANILTNAPQPAMGGPDDLVIPSIELGDPAWHGFYIEGPGDTHMAHGGVALPDFPEDNVQDGALPPDAGTGEMTPEQELALRVNATNSHIDHLRMQPDELLFDAFTKDLETVVRVQLTEGTGTLVNEHSRDPKPFIMNPDSVNVVHFRSLCHDQALGNGDLPSFLRLISFVHQVDASLKHIALYIQTWLGGSFNVRIPSPDSLRRMLLFIELVVRPINSLRMNMDRASVRTWTPEAGFFDCQ